MPTSGQIPVTPGSGIVLDTSQLTVNATTVQRENVVIADPSTAANLVGVTSASSLQTAPAIAQAEPVVYTESTHVNLSTDLGANLRVTNQGQPLVLQKANGSTSGTPGSLAVAYSSNVKVGTLLIAVVGVGGIGTPTIADSQGNTWVNAGFTSQVSVALGCFYAVSKTAGANTVTVTLASESIAMEIYEVSGLAAGAVPDLYAPSANNAATNPRVAGGQLNQPNEFAILAIAVGTSAATITYPASALSGFLTADSSQLNPATPTGLFAFRTTSGISPTAYNIPPSNGFISLGTSDLNVTVTIGFAPYVNSSSGLVTLGSGSAIASVTTVEASRTQGNNGGAMDSISGVAPATSPPNALSTAVNCLTTAPSLATGQSIASQGDWGGSLFVKPHRRSLTDATATTIASSSSAAAVTATPAAGVFADLSALVITTTAQSTGVAFTATLSDGTNSFVYDLNTGSTTALVIQHPIQINFDPPLAATTAATAWTLQLSSSSVTVHVTTNVVLQKAS